MYVADSKQKMVQMVSKGSLEKGQSILRGAPYTVHRSEKVSTYFFLRFVFVLSSLAFDFHRRNVNLATTTFNFMKWKICMSNVPLLS